MLRLPLPLEGIVETRMLFQKYRRDLLTLLLHCYILLIVLMEVFAQIS